MRWDCKRTKGWSTTKGKPMKCHPDTIKATEASLAHWRENVALGFDKAALEGRDCALCVRFYRSRECKTKKEQCPISRTTGQRQCWGTPYNDVISARTSSEFDLAARAEVAFLEAVLASLEPSDNSEDYKPL